MECKKRHLEWTYTRMGTCIYLLLHYNMIMYQAVNPELTSYNHASGLTEAAQIRPIEFQNQQAVPILSLIFWLVD